MKKDNLKKGLLILASAMLLASCGETNNDKSDGSGTDSTDSSNSGNSNTPVTNQYAIIDGTPDGISITLSAAKAKKGETITVTVSLSEGYTLQAIYFNGTECTKVDDTHYTFKMPSTSVRITAKLDVDADVKTNGDLVVAFDHNEDGTYTATVSATKESNIYVISNVGGSDKWLGYTSIDKDASFGYFTSNFSKSEHKDGTTVVSDITLGANGVYKITYNPSNTSPLNIYRTGFVSLPNYQTALESAFCGSFMGRGVHDGGGYNVNNYKSLTYTNSNSGVSYTWNRYADNTSIATATIGSDTYNVYKNVKNGVYTVVDEYIEGLKDANGDYYDSTMANDTVAYSGKYAIKDNVENSHYEMTEAAAIAEVITPSHEMHSIDMESMYAYRTGLSTDTIWEGYTINKSGTSYEGSKKNDDGTYTVKVVSWRNVTNDDSNSQIHYSYEMNTVWNSDSTLKSGSYKEVRYTETNWSFDNNSANGGTATGTGITKVETSYSFGYGEVTENAPTFDTSKYFITSLSDVEIKSTGREDGNVSQYDIIDEWKSPTRKTVVDDYSGGYTSLVSFSYAPNTALDSWQYGVVATSDSNKVSYGENAAHQWYAEMTGDVTLTIGNHIDTAVQATKAVKIVNDKKPTSYNIATYEDMDESYCPNSTAASVKAGKKTTFYLVATEKSDPHPVVTCSNADVKLELSSTIVKAKNSASWQGIKFYPCYTLTIDTTGVTVESGTLSATIIVTDSEASDVSSTIALTIKPGVVNKLPESLVGTTWENVDTSDKSPTDALYNEDDVDSSLAFTSDVSSYTGSYGENETYYVANGWYANTAGAHENFTVAYRYYIDSVGDHKLKLHYMSGISGIDDGYISMLASTNEENGYLGVCMWYDGYGTTSDGDSTSTSAPILGDMPDDNYEETYQWFEISK